MWNDVILFNSFIQTVCLIVYSRLSNFSAILRLLSPLPVTVLRIQAPHPLQRCTSANKVVPRTQDFFLLNTMLLVKKLSLPTVFGLL
jgi:hypothetical protein